MACGLAKGAGGCALAVRPLPNPVSQCLPRLRCGCSIGLGASAATLNAARRLFEQALEQGGISGAVEGLELPMVWAATMAVEVGTSALDVASAAPGAAHSGVILATLCSPGRLLALLEAATAALYSAERASGDALGAPGPCCHVSWIAMQGAGEVGWLGVGEVFKTTKDYCPPANLGLLPCVQRAFSTTSLCGMRFVDS